MKAGDLHICAIVAAPLRPTTRSPVEPGSLPTPLPNQAMEQSVRMIK
jgi:hypothetical protein